MASAGVQPKQSWLRRLRRQKVQIREWRAAPQEAEEHRDSWAGPGAQAAAAESRAAAPHSPRARGRALLHSLRRGSRAILSRVAAVIRPHGQQPGTQQHRSGTAAAAPAAGAQSRAAAPHSPCCVPSPSPGQLEELGLRAGPAGMTLLKELGSEEWHWSDDCQAESGQGESLSESSSYDADELEHYRGTGPFLGGGERSRSEKLRSGSSTGWAIETDLSRSAEEESTSWSLQTEAWPEDTELNRMTREEIGLVSLPRKAWTEDQVGSCSIEEDNASGSLLCESWAESSDSESCILLEDGLDELEAAWICQSQVNPPLLYMGTGIRSPESEGSLSQMEDTETFNRERQTVLKAAFWEDLERERQLIERLQGLDSAAAVPVQHLLPFRRALKALRRAFRSLRHLIPGLHS
ncbi:uncharacterized protein LOC111932476 [Cyanistes caeruleus]|uniref:uncharacterized protein LOC111932476 n=1 Tax=Cyanistes caeruleus TaxID=156563 RepID=UPI000CDA4185|nr:uncharacterized protein LOC111932476 [Cyanistes caeruleus]